MELDKNDSLLLNIYLKTESKYFQKHFFSKDTYIFFEQMNRALQCIPGWSETHFVEQDSLEFTETHQPLPLGCWV